MKVLFVHAHFDDFEFTAAGTFELWRQKFGKQFQGRVLVCTDGKAGHHVHSREETGRIRFVEQQASAQIGDYEFELLRLPNGETIREGVPHITVEFMASLWNAIREFGPDYLLCPPLASDSLDGIHNDHVNVAEAVRRVAYLINVPHAFTPEYPAVESVAKSCRTPVIMTVYDSYMFGSNSYDFAVNVEAAWEKIVAMTWCHRSQVVEWLPWVGRHGLAAPTSEVEWAQSLRKRFEQRGRSLGIATRGAVEAFRVTAWGAIPELKQLLTDFPSVMTDAKPLEGLQKRLALWNHSL